jgi:TonB family protein
MRAEAVMRLTIAAGIIAILGLSLAAFSIPRKIKDVTPVYPPESLQVGDEGAFIIELGVDASGAVQEARIVWSGCQRLEKAALAAVQQWRYEHLVDGKPAAFKMTTTVPFRLPPQLRSRAGRSGACKWKEPPKPIHAQSN